MEIVPTAPIPIASDEPVNQDLICSICMSLPINVPVITPCQHLFCQPCLDQALQIQQLCPVDRCQVRPDQVTTLQEGSLVRRIWANIKVRCGNNPNGCAWMGPVADYTNHFQSCAHGGRNNVSNDSASSEEITSLVRQIELLGNQVEKLEYEKRQKDDELRGKNQQVQRMANEFHELKNSVSRLDPKALGLFNDSYNFGRNDVVRLSQLISVRLEDKPYYIDRNKIFNCVQACFRDWDADYEDNPQHYWTDMKMLLSTCNASTWFTDNQGEKIKDMLDRFD